MLYLKKNYGTKSEEQIIKTYEMSPLKQKSFP